MRFMYVGPSIIGVATRNTTYEETPPSLAEGIKIAPYLSGLCIPPDKLADALQQISRRRGGIYNLYQKALTESAMIQSEIQKGAI